MRRLFILLCAVTCVSARAANPTWFLLPAIFGEVFVGKSQQISQQHNTPYCSLYATATFLELWADVTHPRQARVGSLEPGFLALGYNVEYGSAAQGTWEDYLLYSVWKYGAVTRRAWQRTRFPEGAEHLQEEWADAHMKLIPTEEAKEVLSMPFDEPGFRRPLKAKRFYSAFIGLDPRTIQMLHNDRDETFKEVINENQTPAPVRIENSNVQVEERKKTFDINGFTSDYLYEKPAALYDKIKAQLEKGLPALASINTGFSQKIFDNYDLVTNGDLVKEGEASRGFHTIVIVGVCDKVRAEIPICVPFAKQFEEREISECLLIQNSWGMDAHQKGYVCLSRNASLRMINWAGIQKPKVEPRND